MEVVTNVVSLTPFIAKRSRNDQKRRAFESLLADKVTIRIHVALGPRLVVPQFLREKDQICLEFNGDLTNTRWLNVANNRITVDLTFGQHWSPVSIPWDSVFAIESMNDSRLSVWDEDAPEFSQV